MPIAGGLLEKNRDRSHERTQVPVSVLVFLTFPVNVVVFGGVLPVGIEHHYPGAGKAPLNDCDQFLRVEIKQTAIEEQNLPVTLLQLRQRVGAAQGLLHGTAPPIQPVQDLFPQGTVGAGDQGAPGMSKGRHGRHVGHFKSPVLRCEG